ncbi:MAG: hydrogenase maturation protease [Nitrospirota bacterium]
MTGSGQGKTIRIIGLGNELRGDDAVGLLAARRIRGRVGDRTEVIEAEMAGLEIVELMEGARAVILIDAARSGQAPGSIHRLDASVSPIGSMVFPHSSHAINAVDALELARTLGTLPPTVIVYGIEAGDTETGHPLSLQVARALDDVVERILQESETIACTNSI